MAILFLDLDNTLIDRDEGFCRWARSFLDSMEQADDDVAWFEAADNGGHTSRPALLQMVRDRYGLRESVDELVERFYQELPSCIPPPDPGSRQALIRARDHGWRLCIVTNGGPVQRAKIDAAGLVDLFDGVIISREVGYEKPNPHVLVLGAGACDGHRSRNDWIIGDHPYADIMCAVRADIRSAWITRDRPWRETEYAPTISVASVEGAIGQILTQAGEMA